MLKIKSLDTMKISIILRYHILMINIGTQKSKEPRRNYTIIIRLQTISIKKVINLWCMTKHTTTDTVITTTLEIMDTTHTLDHHQNQQVPIGKCLYFFQF